MSCIIETFYGQYVACSLLPLSTNSLCYGSNTIGIHVTKSSKEVDHILTTVASQLNLKQHIVSQLCDEQKIQIKIPYNVEIHWYSKDEFNKGYLVHLPHNFWVRYTSEIYLRPEIMTNYCSNELEAGFEKFTWKNPVKCNECGRYIIDYEYYVYEKHSFGDRKSILFQYMCCLECYTRLLPSRDFKVPFAKIMRKTLPMSARLVYWKNSQTNEVTFKPPNKKIPLNPDAFDSLNAIDPNHKKDQIVLSNLFHSVRNDFINAMISDLNMNEDSMLIDAEHLARLMHSKGTNLRFIGKLAFQASFNYIREITVITIISRGIKHLVLNALREIDANDDPRDVLISWLNKLLSVSENAISKIAWEQLADYIQTKWDVSIERSVLIKIHMPALLIAVCKQLRINFNNFFKINYLSLTPFSKVSLQMFPLILDEPYYAQSLDIVLAKARTLDRQGKRSQWNIKSGPERERATEYFDKGLRIASSIYQKESLQYAEVALEYAKHLESMHEEDGNPLNSKWNRAAQIPPSKHSESALFFYEDAYRVYEKEGLQYRYMIECMQGLSRLTAGTNVLSNIIPNRKKKVWSIY